MECIARVVPIVSQRTAAARAPTTSQQQQQQLRHARQKRGAVVGPLRATRRGWGETDSRFSRLDKRRDGENPEDESSGDTEKNISFQELRKRQDREQRKVSACAA